MATRTSSLLLRQSYHSSRWRTRSPWCSCARSGSAEQFERGAVRWTARYLERVKPPPDTQEAHLILDAVSALAGPCAEAGVEVLHALSERRGLRDLLRVLDSWQPSE